MAIRTTELAVSQILMRDYDFDPEVGNPPSLIPFMETASLLVDDIADCAAEKGLTLSNAKKEIIERWLSAHFYSRSDLPEQTSSTEGASATGQGQTGKGLEASYYGQTALDIDTTNCLRDLTAGIECEMTWGGKPASEQIPLDERD